MSEAIGLWDVLNNDERIIVLSSHQDGIIYTWNHSRIIECWKRKGNDSFMRQDLHHLPDPLEDYLAAREIAKDFHRHFDF
jgi:hypothetical protein